MLSVLPARPAGRTALSTGQARPVPFLARPARSARVAQCSATAEQDHFQAQVVKSVALSSAAATFLAAGNVSAAQEVADIAAGDGRLGIVALLALPALGWVGFNIFGPALNQLQQMSKKNARAARSLAGLGVGLATLLAAQQAGAQDLPDPVAAVSRAVGRDNRFGIISVVLVPVIGWVLFNITGPALAQINNMQKKQRSVAGAVGLSAAALLAAQQADAASEVTQLAAGDNRFGIIFVVLIPVAGWVLFNITGPALAQLSNMDAKRKGGKR